jgi:hypothetical protein
MHARVRALLRKHFEHTSRRYMLRESTKKEEKEIEREREREDIERRYIYI